LQSKKREAFANSSDGGGTPFSRIFTPREMVVWGSELFTASREVEFAARCRMPFRFASLVPRPPSVKSVKSVVHTISALASDLSEP
jgi:hypothetical protein